VEVALPQLPVAPAAAAPQPAARAHRQRVVGARRHRRDAHGHPQAAHRSRHLNRGEVLSAPVIFHHFFIISSSFVYIIFHHFLLFFIIVSSFFL
jgi:hypothetical protein